MMKEIFDRIWTEAKIETWTDYLKDINDNHTKNVTALMLQNQKLYSEYQEIPNSYEIISKVMLRLLAFKLVSVQPKLGPVSILYYNRYIFSNGEISLVTEYEENLAKTRIFKSVFSNLSIDEIVENIVNEINLEIVTDLWNNCNTQINGGKDIYNEICHLSGILHRKTLRNWNNRWLVMNKETADKYQKYFPIPIKIHIVKNFRNDGILMGLKGDSFIESDYFWSPYIMLGRTSNILSGELLPRQNYIIRYGKKLRNYGKCFGRISLS